MNVPAVWKIDHTAHRRVPALAVALVFIAMALCALPITARADDYSMDSVSIEAQVNADGSLSVTETRAFSFDEDVNGIYWLIALGDNQQGKSSDVQIDGVQCGFDYAQVESANKGDYGVYTVEHVVDGSTDAVRLKVFNPHSGGSSATVTVRYTMTGAVMNWADTAELYWKFIGDGWSESSRNVTATVSFSSDLTAANPAKTGKTFRAWGHGPLTGDVSLDDAAATVTYTIPRVKSGEYAEARIAFPSAWVPGLAASNDKRMGTILSEEQQWADEANARRERARMLGYVLAGVTVAGSAVLFIVVAVLKATRGRSPKPVFEDEYFRDLPGDVHPAVVATFMERHGSVPDRAFVASLMKLTDDRVVSMELTRVKKKGLLGHESEDEDYRLAVKADVQKATPDKIDRAVLGLYFAGVKADADGIKARTFDDLHKYASKHSETYSKRMDTYKAKVKADIEARNLVASTGAGAMAATCVIAALLAIFGVFQLIYTDFNDPNLIAFCISVVLLVGAIAMGSTFRRFTQEGAELKSRCAALKHWLEDFTHLKEAVPGDLVLWNKLMVMAVALGVSQRTLRELADAVPPEVREQDDFYDYYPVYWWCYGHDDMDAPSDALSAAYQDSIAELAKSSDSSAGGSGGGFSSGGGGGVGGGGGGTF